MESSAKRILYQARHDPLTKLYNRREFSRKLKDIFENTNNETQYKPTLCFIDLDRFKAVNDTCGHAAGDDLLVILANEIQKNAGKNSIIARMGGDEFAILFTEISKKDCHLIAKKILDNIRSIKFENNAFIYRISASIGLTHINDTRVNVTEWLNAADSACFIAKRQGRDTIQTFKMDDE